jgi:hypothetical protein
MPLRADDQLPAKRYSLGPVETYEIVRRDFESIGREATNIGTAFAFAAALLPVGITLTATLITSTVSNNNIREALLTLMWVCYILGGYFAVLAYRQRGNLQRFMGEIRDSQVPPIAAKTQLPQPDLTATNDPNSPASPVDDSSGAEDSE